MDNELLGLLGLAKKAGKAVPGEEAVLAAALGHKLRLILLSADIAENAAGKLLWAAEEGNARCFRTDLSRAELGGAVGLAACAAVGVTDVGLAAAVLKKLAAADPQRYGQAAEALSHKADKSVRRRREKVARQKAEKSQKPWAAPPKPPRK